jgi:hypothetical protein
LGTDLVGFSPLVMTVKVTVTVEVTTMLLVALISLVLVMQEKKKQGDEGDIFSILVDIGEFWMEVQM